MRCNNKSWPTREQQKVGTKAEARSFASFLSKLGALSQHKAICFDKAKAREQQRKEGSGRGGK
jgi:hypothetical protein